MLAVLFWCFIPYPVHQKAAETTACVRWGRSGIRMNDYCGPIQKFVVMLIGGSMFKFCLQILGASFCPFKNLWSKDFISSNCIAGRAEVKCLPQGNILELLPFMPLFSKWKRAKICCMFSNLYSQNRTNYRILSNG